MFVFTGNPDCKILVEDWVCDMQYLLEALELPTHLRFSRAVRHPVWPESWYLTYFPMNRPQIKHFRN